MNDAPPLPAGSAFVARMVGGLLTVIPFVTLAPYLNPQMPNPLHTILWIVEFFFAVTLGDMLGAAIIKRFRRKNS